MFKGLDLFTQRYIQIVMVMMLIQAIYQFGHVPHSSWLITASAIYSGFDPGSVLKRASGRIYGTFAGIALVTIIWYLVHFDYRWLILLTCLMVFIISYGSLLPYSIATIVNTAFSDVSMEWSNSDTFNLQYYLIDRVICNLIVIGICVACERFWFGHSNLPFLNFKQVRANLIKTLRQMYLYSQTRTAKGKTIKSTQTFMLNINKLKTLSEDIRNEGKAFFSNAELMLMIHELRTIHSKIVGLIYLQIHQPDNLQIRTLYNEIEQKLNHLESEPNFLPARTV